jgi:hypothetical protein
MSLQNGYERMHELIGSLRSALGRLEEGKLGPEGLEHATEEARMLYERLIVLRHKVREAALGKTTKAAKEAPPSAPEIAPIRLDTRPAEVSPHQTSLIDAIAETEGDAPGPRQAAPEAKAMAEPVRPPRPKPAPKAGDRPVTVAGKLEHAPVADLHKAIALSQKFWFIAEIFGGQREFYEKTINALNAMGNAQAAEAHLRHEVLDKLEKPPGEDVLATFMELLHRRFR